MIARLVGTIAEKSPERVVLDVHGVGYLVHVSLQTFTDLPALGANVDLRIHTEVREDAIELIGFLTAREQAMFNLLRKVKGLGPRTTLGVLSGMPAAELAQVIASGDATRLQTIPGVGKKFADRIVVECKDAAARLADATTTPRLAIATRDGAAEEAVSALVNLGYKRHEAERVIERIAQPDLPLEELIRAALQGLAG